MNIDNNSLKKSKFNNLSKSLCIKSTNIQLDREEKLKNVFGGSIITTINSFSEMQANTKSYLQDILQVIDKKYTDFNQEINNHINSTANKYIKAFELEESEDQIDNEKNILIQKYSKNYLKIFQKIISLHNKIFESIKENFEIIKKFFEISKILDKEKPIQEFLSEEFNNIINSWLFLKLDFEKFNFIKALKNSKLSNNMKKFISNICNDQNLLLNIGQNKWDTKINKYMINQERERERESKFKSKKFTDNKMLKENSNNLMKINISNIKDIKQYFDSDMTFPKAKSLSIDNVSKIPDKFLYYFPNLEKLQIKYCPSLDNNLMSNLSNNITKLYLTNNNFVDYDFNFIMSNYIIKNNNIRNNLKILSFANNEITKVDFDILINNKREIFRELKQIDLHKNKIYKLNFNPEYFPELQFINCCRNCFDHYCFKTINHILIMQSANDFLTDKELYREYYSSLAKILNKNNSFPIKYLNISYLPSIYSNKYLSDLIIASSICINLKKLDLSYNKLKSETFLQFAKNNKGCLNVKVLNLNGNELDDNFFELYLQKGIKNVFTKLEHLYLSNNKIGNNDVSVKYTDEIPIYNKNNEKDINKLRLLYKFIEENRKLTKLNITKNPLKEKLIIKYEPGGAANFNEKYIKRNNDDNIIINCFFSFLVKIKNELLSKEDFKIYRNEFVVIFDCKSSFNLNSETYPFNNYPIIFKELLN